MNSHESSPLLETADGENEIEVHYSKTKKKNGYSHKQSRTREKEAQSDSRPSSNPMNRIGATISGEYRSGSTKNAETEQKINTNGNGYRDINAIRSLESSQSSRTFSEIVVNLSIDDALEEVSEILCLFVASFDARRGNMIEWRIPTGFNLDGVEFKAIPSGMHSINRDYIMFKHRSYFGVAAFASVSLPEGKHNGGMRLNGEKEAGERGVRSRSVGVLCASYANITSHLRFLESTVQAQLEAPRAFGELSAYFERFGSRRASQFGYPRRQRCSTSVDEDSTTNRFYLSSQPSSLVDAGLNNSDSLLVISSTSQFSGNTRDSYLKDVRVHDADASFYEFVKVFGVRLFALWRLTMLRRRILFYTTPPVGVSCYHVYWCAALGNHVAAYPSCSSSSYLSEQFTSANPLFLIALVDAARIADEERRISAASSNRTPTHTPTHAIKAGASSRLRASSQTLNDTPTRTSDLRLHSNPTNASKSSSVPIGETGEPMFAGAAWIACTSDRLFEVKSNLYDALVCAPQSAVSFGSPKRKRGEVIRVTDPRVRYAATVSPADRSRMRKLAQLTALAETREARDSALRAYFTHLNTELLSTLHRVASRTNADDRVLNAANVRSLQLDPTDPTDRQFLTELIDILELELTVNFDSPSVFARALCPCCNLSTVE